MAVVMNGPIRSISLPSRLQPNPIEAELNEVKSIGGSSGSQICSGFTKLAKLYNKIEEMIQSPHTQQALHHQQNVKIVEEALDYSVGLLDACGTSRELILMMKEQIQTLESALRRRGGDSSIKNNILTYISFRKKSVKIIGKSLRMLKRLESSHNSISPLFDVDSHLLMALKESNAIAISLFRSLLSFLSMPETKGGGWSLISKLIPVSTERSQKLFNEVGIVDFTLHAIRKKDDAKFDAQIEVRRLETLYESMEGLEAGLDCLFRCLVRNRVALLNILTP